MSKLIEAAQSAERILLPKGSDCKPAINAFTEATGIEVPDFAYRKYIATSQGKEFFSVSAKDVTKLVEQGKADVGVTGEDQYIEALGGRIWTANKPLCEVIGPPMCYLAVLASEEDAASVRRNLFYTRGRSAYSSERVVTSFPNLVNGLAATRDLYLEVYNTCQGSTEAMPRLLGCRAVVDIVGNGDTALANELVVVEKLMDIAPVLIGRA
jgi:ATP phosphoribosyltransferase